MLERIMGESVEEYKRDEAVGQEIKPQHSVCKETGHSGRILLAEDNPVNQKLAKLMLTKVGYQVEVANDGKEAVERYTACPEDFALILMDIQMPEMDGIQATGAIRNWETSLAAGGSGKGQSPMSNGESEGLHIPIIAMTAHAMKGDKERCLEAGMDDFITKPIKREAVLGVLEKWILDNGAL
jgi:CheY-like chemotaxis protein